MAELGWIGAAFPKGLGGYAESHVEAMIVMQSFGRHLVVEPYVITAVVCGVAFGFWWTLIHGPVSQNAFRIGP